MPGPSDGKASRANRPSPRSMLPPETGWHSERHRGKRCITMGARTGEFSGEGSGR